MEKILLHRDYTASNFTQKVWLWCIYFLVLVMIMLGGATRLTKSGLSIVEWQPITGVIPPLNENKWKEAFQSYKKYPEYQQVNRYMNLKEFKFIYMMEYSHRLLGRFIALFVLIPLIIFSVRRTISLTIQKYSFYLFLLIVLQGFLGWYMVKSGLSNLPYVSHFRLSLHLLMALIIQGVVIKIIDKLTIIPPNIQFQKKK